MELSRVKNGRPVKNISAIGAITARRASASNSIKMEISMKACGPSISAMARVLIGRMKERSCAESTLVTGMKTKSMEEVRSSTRTETGTMATGSMDCLKVKAV